MKKFNGNHWSGDFLVKLATVLESFAEGKSFDSDKFNIDPERSNAQIAKQINRYKRKLGMKGKPLSELSPREWVKLHKYVLELGQQRISEDSKKRKLPKRKTTHNGELNVDVEAVALALSNSDLKDKILLAFDKERNSGTHSSPALIEYIENIEPSKSAIMEKMVEETANKKRTREIEKEQTEFNKKQKKKYMAMIDELKQCKKVQQEKENKINSEKQKLMKEKEKQGYIQLQKVIGELRSRNSLH